MSDLSVFRVIADFDCPGYQQMKELGLTGLAREIFRKEVAKTAKLCKQAVRAYAPVYGGELRNSVQIDHRSSYEAKVFIPELSHNLSAIGPGGALRREARRATRKSGVRISNSTLAKILDEGRQRLSPPESPFVTRNRARRTSHGRDMQRSQDALRDGPFTGPKRQQPTADWIHQAQDALERELNKNGRQ